MSPLNQSASWDTEGIKLTSPDNPEFDALIRSLFKGNVEELLKSRSFLERDRITRSLSGLAGGIDSLER
jgi:hypothetical protein